jgi:hypothetical protein
MILIISKEELRMLVDDFKTSVDNLSLSVDALASRITAVPPAAGGTVPDAVVSAGVTIISDATKKLDSLLAPKPVPAPAPAGPAIATDFANPLK